MPESKDLYSSGEDAFDILDGLAMNFDKIRHRLESEFDDLIAALPLLLILG